MNRVSSKAGLAWPDRPSVSGSSRKTILLLLLLSLSACTRLPETTAFDKSIPRTDIDGYPFHTEVYGNSNLPAVIMVHGGPGADFRYLLPLKELSDKYRVIFYDQRGTGLSPREDTKDHTIDQFVKDLDGLVNAFSGGRPVRLIGHSWGGMLVTAYAARHPEKVSHAVIAEPGMLNWEAAKAFIGMLNMNRSFMDNLKMVPYLTASIFVKTEDGHERKDFVMTKILSSINGPPYMCAGERLPASASVQRAGFSSFEAMMMPVMREPALFNGNLAEGIENYKGHLLLLSGECSFIRYDYQEKYHAPLLPRSARHLKIENEGHYMLTTKAEESMDIIREFFEQ